MQPLAMQLADSEMLEQPPAAGMTPSLQKHTSCRYLPPAQFGSAGEDSNERTSSVSSVSAMSESLKP